MKSYPLTRLLALTAALAILIGTSASAQAAPDISDPSSGYVIPAYGDDVQIIEVYAAHDGHLVFEVAYNHNGEFHVAFYDTRQKERLFKGREAEIAENDGLKNSLIKSTGLTNIPLALNGLSLADNAKINNHYRDGRTCLWPYGGVIETLTHDGVPNGSTVLTVNKEPKTKPYRRDCEDSRGTVKLTTKYRQEFGRFFADNEGGAWAVLFESPYAIHYDRDGKTSFFKGRNDIVSMQPDSIDRIRDRADKGGQVAQEDQQRLIEKTEGIIDGVLASQLD